MEGSQEDDDEVQLVEMVKEETHQEEAREGSPVEEEREEAERSLRPSMIRHRHHSL
jgi:hypothetical protein